MREKSNEVNNEIDGTHCLSQTSVWHTHDGQAGDVLEQTSAKVTCDLYLLLLELLSLEMVAFGTRETMSEEKTDCGDDDADVDDEKNALLFWLVLEGFAFILTFNEVGNGGNGGGDGVWVGGNSSYVNGGIFCCGEIFCKDVVTVMFECSSLWLGVCWDDNLETLLANDLWQEHECEILVIGSRS